MGFIRIQMVYTLMELIESPSVSAYGDISIGSSNMEVLDDLDKGSFSVELG